jgi:hypothetical protein
MQHNKNTEFVMYVDNFLSAETLESLQETLTNINYSEVKNPEGQIYGYRHNNKEPLFHVDVDKGNVANFLFFVKGEPLLNNGTGFMKGQSLSSHIGFIENRALFFNGSKISHSDLQSFGDSSKRYTLNIFYHEA